MRIDLNIIQGLDGAETIAELCGIPESMLASLLDEANFLLTSGATERARERLEAYVTLNPRTGEGWSLLARAYDATGDQPDAVQAKLVAERVSRS